MTTKIKIILQKIIFQINAVLLNFLFTKDWSNDAENSALITAINYILICIQIENIYFVLKKIFHNITVFTVFLISIGEHIRDFFQKHLKNPTDPKLVNCIYYKGFLSTFSWLVVSSNN